MTDRSSDGTRPANRQSTGKQQRFEVFKRDSFTCQYCGAQPPGVLLVVDHIVPKAGGGSNAPENLMTACEACNQGKSDKPLGNVIVRPDADLMYLAVQQEKAELERYEGAKVELGAIQASFAERVAEAWESTSGMDWSPKDHVILWLLTKYGPEITEAAMGDVALKLRTGYLKRHGAEWIKYLYATARGMSGDRATDAPVVGRLQHDWRVLAGTTWHPDSRTVRDVLAEDGAETAEMVLCCIANRIRIGTATDGNWRAHLREVLNFIHSRSPEADAGAYAEHLEWKAEVLASLRAAAS